MLVLQSVGMHSLDAPLFLWLNLDRQAPPALVWLALASSRWLPFILLPTLVPMAALGGARSRRTVLLAVLSMGLAWSMAWLLKQQIEAPRPFMLGLGTEWLQHSRNNGFPSSHTAVAMAWAMSMALGPWRWPWRVAALLCGVLMGWSRIALGVHFPSDVLAAALLGTLSAWLLHAVAGRIRPAAAHSVNPNP
ncbi:phosphatase PAP2 family protein [Ottowia testudinis]|uniref:Phosphatase PAP2 family protein n=1 Tax=Ottowia testudinis TaxID=2816950 RepID=A0A975CH05_9BURK|nr:phosphatase PAP2 family protein [Ottowia testudinis]QTD45636.1 phosphatase PAP2 family protein [Ottowia testudinis]